MNRAKFFARLRIAFGPLSNEQVQGTEALLDACEARGVTALPHVAHVLAEVRHETGGYMLPIKETVYASHKDKNPSDAVVMARLEKAWKAGRLGTVKTPYWRKGWFGRGQIQLTHETGYRKMGRRLGVDLVANPSLALDLKISSDIAVLGMKEGMFRVLKLADFGDEQGYDHRSARAIVNGDVKTNGAKIAKYAASYEEALRAGGFGEKPVKKPEPIPPASPAPAPVPAPAEAPKSVWRVIADLIGRLLK